MSADTKARLQALAQRQRITESAAIRQLLELTLRYTPHSELASAAPQDAASSSARLYVRLKPDDAKLLTERAAARRIPAATYVSFLVSAHLRALAPLPKLEYQALKEAVGELAAIGRNLNHIDRELAHGGWPTLPGKAEVKAMLRVAVALRDHFRGLITTNARSWTSR